VERRRAIGNGAGGQQNRIAERFIAAAPPVEHSSQHWHVQIGVIIHPHFAFAVVEAMKPAHVLSNGASP